MTPLEHRPMPRRNNSLQRRKQLIPIIAGTFAELGYRRTTTAELSKRCCVQETILYRLWPDKKKMFLAAIEYVYKLSIEKWSALLDPDRAGPSPAERILEYEAKHHGEFGLYRIVFAGLSETDDPEIQKTLKEMYTRFHRFIQEQIAAYHSINGKGPLPAADLSAWALVGLGTVSNIGRELGLLTDRRRRRLFREIGRLLLDGRIE
jgi:AcrR family transcriptional regulator